MATAADVDLTGWVRQLESPFYDGNNPSVLRNPTSAYFFGYPYVSISSITIPSIEVAPTSTEAPMAVFASASNVSATGTRTKTSNTVKPYTDLEYRWTLTKNDDSAVEDVEGLTDPRTGNGFNPYTDQISPEFTCILREPGTYKLKLTARGMSSTFGTVIEQTRTETITVTASTLSKVWYDGVGGDDANDGLDPWGFGLTTASYTESTRELTQSGAFASYVHDVSVPHTFRDNYIYIDKAGFEGLYEIESKTSNDTIVLATGLGSDQSSVTSSDGPKQTFTGGGTSGEESMVKAGTDYNFSSSFAWAGRANPLAITGYGGTPTMYTTTSNALFNTFTGSGSSTPSYFRASNVVFDPQNGAGTSPARSVGGTMTASADTGNRTIIFDNITAQNGSESNELDIQSTQGASVNYHLMFYNMTVDGRYNSTGRGASRQGLFTDVDGDSWQRAVCMTIDNDADDSTLDHFWYPSGNLDHFHVAYCHTRNGSGNNYAFNTNHEVGTDCQYISINNNFCDANSRWLTDLSNNNTDEYTDVLIMNNKSNVSDGMVFQVKGMGVRCAYNQHYNGISGQNFYLHFGTGLVYTNAESIIDNNEVYGDNKLFDDDKGYSHEVVDNTIWTTRVGVAMAYDYTDITEANYTIDGNNFYAPNKGNTSIIDEDGSDITVATLNTRLTVTNTSSQPSWPDPANGNFGGVPTGMEVSL